MGIPISINSGEKREFEALSEGLHQGIIADVIDEGIKESQWGPKRRFKVVFMTDEADSNGYTKTVATFLKTKPPEAGKPLTFHVKSNAYKELVKILGKDVPNGFDLEQLIGIRKGLIIQHSEDAQGTVWANIVGYMKPTSNTVQVPESYTRKKDRPQSQFTPNPVKAAGGGKAVAAAAYSKGPITDDDLGF